MEYKSKESPSVNSELDFAGAAAAAAATTDAAAVAAAALQQHFVAIAGGPITINTWIEKSFPDTKQFNILTVFQVEAAATTAA